MLPTTLSVAMAFLPPIAALKAHRSFVRDPAGQTAACWLVMALVGAVEMAAFFGGVRLPPFVSLGVTGAFPLLLLPPLLTWIGPSWKRWQWPALVAWLALWAVATRLWPDPRPFKAVVDTPMSVTLCALNAVALAAQIRRQPAAPARTDWFWILTGQVMYFAANMFRLTVIEALVARHWDAIFPVNDAFVLLFSVAYLVIARGMLLPAVGTSSLYAGPVGRAA